MGIKEYLSPGDSGSPIFLNKEVYGMLVYGIGDGLDNSSTIGTNCTVALKSMFIKEILNQFTS